MVDYVRFESGDDDRSKGRKESKEGGKEIKEEGRGKDYLSTKD